MSFLIKRHRQHVIFNLLAAAAANYVSAQTLTITEAAKNPLQEEKTLGEVKVQATAEKETASTPVIGYRAKRSATATKTDTPLAETPQSVTVVTRTQMEDQGATSLQDALLYGAGVRANNYGFDTRGDWVRVRGTEAVQYIDGLQQLFGFYNNTRPEPFGLERVEVLRGPSSVLYGQGSTGGIINLASKLPQAEQQGEIGIQLGNRQRQQLQGDVTGPITADGRWLYRLIAVGRRSDTQVDHVPDDRQMLAPSLTWRPSEQTQLTLQAHGQNDNLGSSVSFLPFSGTIQPNQNGRISTSRFVSEPGFDRYDMRRRSLGYLFEHRLSQNWAVRQNARLTKSAGVYQTLYPGSIFADPLHPYLDSAQRIVSRFIYVNKRDARTLAVDQHIEGLIKTNAVEHRLLLGLNINRYSERAQTGFDVAPDLDLYAPVYGNYTAPTLAPDPALKQHQVGIYIQEQMKFASNWLLMAGLRHDRASNAVQDVDTEKDRATTKRAALMYFTAAGWSPYVSYSESFQPIIGVDFYGKRYQPQRGEQLEVGAKYAPANGHTTINLALYDLREKNRQISDPTQPLNKLQAGKTKTRGAEAEIQTQLNHHIDVLAHYEYTDIDHALEAVPKHQASIWGKYRFALNEVGGFSAGLGLRYAGAFLDDTAPMVRAYVVTDAMIAYDAAQWRLSLNVNNMSDKVYESTCLRSGECYYAARRNVLISATYRF